MFLIMMGLPVVFMVLAFLMALYNNNPLLFFVVILIIVVLLVLPIYLIIKKNKTR
jgi:hypothetical protein